MLLPLSLLLSCASSVDPCFGAHSGDTACSDEGGDEGLTCIQIDRLRVDTFPPAGVGVGFRVLDCAGDPIRPLTEDDIVVINGETDEPFNASSEGGAASAPGNPDKVRIYAMLVLDFSRSIFEAGAEEDVVDGALAFIDATLVNGEERLDYEIGIVAFGGPDETELIADFTDDPNELQRALSAAVAHGSRGTTDLYGAYTWGLELLGDAGPSGAEAGTLVERIAVVWSDGAHEAGDEAARRQQAMEAKTWLDGTAFSIGVQSDDAVIEAVKELATSESAYFGVDDASELSATFEAISERAEAVADSNYTIGVCSPVALGEPWLRIELDLDDAYAKTDVDYSTDGLTGNVDDCAAEDVRTQMDE